MKLAGKTAIVTGGGRDIGAAVARRFAAEGANVAISYFESSKGADAVVADIEKAGGKAIAVQADLSTQAGVDTLVGEAAGDVPGDGDQRRAEDDARQAHAELTEAECLGLRRI